MAHINVCSIRNKIDELRCLQLSCKFEVLAITETHLDKSIPSTSLKIDGMKMLRFDRLDRKGGGCILYFAEYLNATHRRDLSIKGLEAIWLQVKFPQTTVLSSVIYRPPDAKNFFNLISIPLEKAWLKSSSIFLLGDFNCDLSSFNIPQNRIADSSTIAPTINSSKLISIFDMSNMQNVINEPTRVTPTTSSLIDLIVTTRKDLVTSSAAVPLGLSDHNLIYATLRLKNKRPPPTIIKTRDYKKLDKMVFHRDISTAPFDVGSVFDDPDDRLWAWQTLFLDICNDHVPYKEVKIRSQSAPWITNEIRYKRNKRFKVFKEAISTKRADKWSVYKKIRNEVISDIRKAKASYFNNMFNEVKDTGAYWNLIKKATNQNIKNKIGPLKRDDGTLALINKDKADLFNFYFSRIGENLASALPDPEISHVNDQGSVCVREVPTISEVNLTQHNVRREIKELKTNKSTGPDNIADNRKRSTYDFRS